MVMDGCSTMHGYCHRDKLSVWQMFLCPQRVGRCVPKRMLSLSASADRGGSRPRLKKNQDHRCRIRVGVPGCEDLGCCKAGKLNFDKVVRRSHFETCQEKHRHPDIAQNINTSLLSGVGARCSLCQRRHLQLQCCTRHCSRFPFLFFACLSGTDEEFACCLVVCSATPQATADTEPIPTGE